MERMYYSVPYEYIQSEVHVRFSKGLIEVYFNDTRIASHKKLTGTIGQYVTLPEHMPDNHRLFLEHTPVNSREWDKEFGPNMLTMVEFLLINGSDKKALNQLMSSRSLMRKYTTEELELAAQNILIASSRPTVSVFKAILVRNKKRLKAQSNDTLITLKTNEAYGFVRGAHYFGSKK